MTYKDPQKEQQYREEHKEHSKLSQAIRRGRNIQFIWDYLMEHPCVDCGYSDPIALEFDHVRRQKKFAVAGGSGSFGRSIETIKKEIAKCEVRCANCHKIRHWKERNPE